MRKVYVLLTDDEEQVIRCESYDVIDGVLTLGRVSKINEFDVNEHGKAMLMFNMVTVKSVLIEWMD